MNIQEATPIELTAEERAVLEGMVRSPKRMATVPAGAGVSECVACHHAQAQGVVEFTMSQQARIGRDNRTAKLERQSAVEIEPEGTID
jgi:hypothetical protein